MKPGSELSWVSIEQNDAHSVIYLAPKVFDNGKEYGEYQFFLESYDRKSKAVHPKALKTDLIVVKVIRPSVCRQAASTTVTFKPEV